MTIGVTTVNFSANEFLVDQLKKTKCQIKLNPYGRRLTHQELIELLSDCDLAIVGLDIINEDILKRSPKLRRISKYGVGLDNIDLEACSKRNIDVKYSPGINKRSVSELALGMILSLSRKIYEGSVQLKNKKWVKEGGTELTGKKVGIVGYGNIGRDLSELLYPFKNKIYACDINESVFSLGRKSIKVSSFEEILTECDVISFHVPLTEKTTWLINSSNITKLKPGVIIINTARGGILEEKALIMGLTEGLIGGLGIDVYDIEPPYSSGLLDIKNTICTPHIGGNSYQAVRRMGMTAIKNLFDEN